MKLYIICLSLTDEISNSIYESIFLEFIRIGDALNEQLNENCNLIKNINKKEFIIKTENSEYVCGFILQTDNYLRKNSINFLYTISLIDTIKYIQKSEKSDIKDTIDFFNKYIQINTCLAPNDHIIHSICYFQKVNDIMYSIDLKINKLNSIDFMVSVLYDEADKIEFSQVISVLNAVYRDFTNTIYQITTDKEWE